MHEGEVEVATLAGTVVLFLLLASVLAFTGWIRRWVWLGYVLAYQPRRRTPWGPVAGVLALLMTVMGIGNALVMRGGEASGASDLSASEFAAAYWQMTLVQIGFTVAIVAVLVFVVGASHRDLGLPSTPRELGADLTLGLWTGLALMVPVYVLQLVAVNILGIPPGHPLLDQMQHTPDPGVFVVAMIAAVIVAPVFEEIVYRLLLQGGLERMEDERIGWPFSQPARGSEQPVQEPSQDEQGEQDKKLESGEATPASLPEDISDAPVRAAGEELCDTATEPEYLPALAPGGIGMLRDLGHGWAPILASSFLFALAHLGAGPSPIPLFVLAMFLGYVYQRTHRILPCIIAHVVMNLTSVTVLILQIMSAK